MDLDQVLSHRDVLGSLAGIGEIAKATFGERAATVHAAVRRATSVPPARPRTRPKQG